MTEHANEARRLEQLWRGEFGDDYSQRNADAGGGRKPFWRKTLDEVRPHSILEVGCNVGGNLRWAAETVDVSSIVGVDVNEAALGVLRRDTGARAVAAAAQSLPFRDRSFDLVFTIGVLIHQPPTALRAVMSEVVRCSARLVLCGEYYAQEPTEVEYRGLERALWKRDFGSDYLSWFPDLELMDQGFLARVNTGWDDVTWWLMRRR